MLLAALLIIPCQHVEASCRRDDAALVVQSRVTRIVHPSESAASRYAPRGTLTSQPTLPDIAGSRPFVQTLRNLHAVLVTGSAHAQGAYHVPPHFGWENFACICFSNRNEAQCMKWGQLPGVAERAGKGFAGPALVTHLERLCVG